jgi:hypothetical protein
MSRQIALTQGVVALVDDEDFEILSKQKWFCSHGYAMRKAPRVNGKQKNIYMHRVVVNAPDGMVVDHINGNKSDSQNLCNRGKTSANTSGVKGVFWHKTAKKWQASICINGSLQYLGLFASQDEASHAYCRAADELHRDFANHVEKEMCDVA